MSFDNPAFGIYPAEDREISAVGSLNSISKKAMNGWWCPYCYESGMYTWLQTKHNADNAKRCGECGEVSARRMEEVVALMVSR